MGEHHANKQAIMRAMLPTFPVGADYSNVQMRGGFTLRRDVLIVPPEKMRTTDDGSVEVLAPKEPGSSEETWAKPEGTEVVAEGTKLGFEHFDYVVHLMGSCVTRTIVNRENQHPMALVPLEEIYRMPAPLFLRHFVRESAPNGVASLVVPG